MPRDTTSARELLPTFYGSPLTIAVSVFDFIHARTKKTIWTNERIRARYTRRSASDILEDGDVLAFGPCPDRTQLAAAILYRNHLPFVVVYHERRVPGYGPSTAHFAIELKCDEREYMMDFGSRESRFISGTYSYRQDIEETIALKRFDCTNIDVFDIPIEQMAQAISPVKMDMSKKFDWYERQLTNYNPAILQERITYDMRCSVYNEL